MDIAQETMKKILQCLLPLVNKRVTVFFTGAFVNMNQQMEAIDGLMLRQADIVMSEGFKTILQGDIHARFEKRIITEYPKMQAAVQRSRLVLVPAMTRNTLAKTAAGIQDNLVTNGLATALMLGIPVIAVKDNYDPAGEHIKKLGFDRNPAYNAMLLGHEKQLESFGVKLVDGREFSCSIKETLYPEIFCRGAQKKTGKIYASGQSLKSQPLITCQDVMGLESGSTLTLLAGTVITPLAKEYLTREGIRLVFPDQTL